MPEQAPKAPEASQEAQEKPNSFELNIDAQGKARMDEIGLSIQDDKMYVDGAPIDVKFMEVDSINVTAEGAKLIMIERSADGTVTTYRGETVAELADNMLYEGIQWFLETQPSSLAVREQYKDTLRKIIKAHPEWKTERTDAILGDN